jgi:hypothetical protein
MGASTGVGMDTNVTGSFPLAVSRSDSHSMTRAGSVGGHAIPDKNAVKY